MADAPLLTVCAVTYNSEKHIGNLLSAVLQSSIVSSMRVYVVDNASTDGTVALVQKTFPQVHLVQTGANLGFGQAHNRMLPLLDAPYHLIVNPDITFAPDLLEAMTAFLEDHPEAASLTPRVLNPDGSEQFLPKELPSLHFLAGGYFEKLGRPFTSWRAAYTWKGNSPASPKELSFATGCFMLVRSSAFQAVGGFDKRYFMYGEDIDLTRKLKTQGKTLYHPDFSVTHVWARENTRSMKGTKLLLTSMTKYFCKWGWRI